MTNTCTYRTGIDEETLVEYYYNDVKKVPCLSAEQEYELAKRAKKGDKAARDEMVSANLRFVIKIANEFRGYGMSFTDLISEGNIGLINAVDKFDPEKGNKFVTYAVWWIRQSIIKALQDKGRAIRIPANKYIDLMKLKKTESALSSEMGGEPDIEELAKASDLSVSKIRDLLDMPFISGSLDQKLSGKDGEDSGTVADMIPSTDPGPEAMLLKTDREDTARQYLNLLSDKEKNVLKMRFGFDGLPEMSLQDIGEELGLTKERIRQIENKAIVKLQNAARLSA